MTFPYAGLPRRQVWKRAVAGVAPETVDPQSPAGFFIDRSTRISSAGSCFAARIADALRANGFTYLVTEAGPADEHYGVYSARYGEIYTTLQLAQTLERALGLRVSLEPPWHSHGRWYDPLRPRVVPGGFASPGDLDDDRRRHESAIVRAIREADVFVFTLGLTETWYSRADGTAFPLCPGAGIGTFDEARHAFCNLDVDANVTHLETFLALAWGLNPALRVILTVSPVPLAVTIEPQHVIAATTYSKAVLRVAAETLRRRHAQVEYFASYEIVTAAGIGPAFEADGRTVREAVVARVMRSFFAAFAPGVSIGAAVAPNTQPLPAIQLSLAALDSASIVTPGDLCNEDYLATFIGRGDTR